VVKKYLIDEVAKRIAGSIVWDENPSQQMRRWREYFGITQTEIAKFLRLSPSVISDYEKGKRKPGSEFIRKFVNSIISLDLASGGEKISELITTMGLGIPSIIEMGEYKLPVNIEKIVKAVNGVIINSAFNPNMEVRGFTIIDSIEVIINLRGESFYKLLGSSYDKILVFTKVTTGRSPLISLKISPIKPRVVILHRPIKLDWLACYLANYEEFPLIVSLLNSEEELTLSLKRIQEV
jgi:putative transcriptional regulator